MTLPRVVLQPRKARPFYGRHPWVFPGAIADVSPDATDGAEVDVVSHAGNFVARGLYNSQSRIRVRLYCWSETVFLDRDFFRSTLAAAIRLRDPILGWNRPGAACRLVFSEGDGLSGCTIDRYDRWLVLQFSSLALAQRCEILVELLVELLRPDGIILRTERGIGRLEGLEASDGLLWGQAPEGHVTIDEDGVRFLVDLLEGQKTGFYLDQRENRAAAAKYAPGRRVLDAFCYTGGFGLAALHGGAESVLGVDMSEPALALARENAGLNGLSSTEYVRADVFDQLDTLVQEGRRFGMVVLDPPKFARTRQAIDEALRGYRRLHTLALRLLEADGILVSCCCSGLITMDMLIDLLGQVASDEKRFVQILQRRGQAADHPVAATCPDSSYLKCLICRII
jgi:23S rRNA (cytosine1962-C5)-methyltransferase